MTDFVVPDWLADLPEATVSLHEQLHRAVSQVDDGSQMILKSGSYFVHAGDPVAAAARSKQPDWTSSGSQRVTDSERVHKGTPLWRVWSPE